MKRTITIALIILGLSGCQSTEYKVNLPTIANGGKAYVSGDTLIVAHHNFGDRYATVKLTSLGCELKPVAKNTLSYSMFSTKKPKELANAQELSLEICFAKVEINGGLIRACRSNGVPLPTEKAGFYNYGEYSGEPNHVGYVVMMPGHSPTLFFIKPETFTFQSKPGFMGWKD